jgi:hypothetical protein
MEFSGETPFKRPLIVTPAVAAMAKLIEEYELLEADDHPELRALKEQLEEELQCRMAWMRMLIEEESRIQKLQSQCEIQSAKEELEDFENSQKKETLQKE